MGQERLSSLALLHINYSIKIDLDAIIDIFARNHSRRMWYCTVDYKTTKLLCVIDINIDINLC